MKKLLMLIGMLANYGLFAMDTQGSIQLLSPTHSPFASPRSHPVSSQDKSFSSELDQSSSDSDSSDSDSDWPDWDKELAVVAKPTEIKTLQDCYTYLKVYDKDTLELFANLVSIKKSEKKALDVGFGVGLYQDGVACEVISILGMPQYFLTDTFVKTVKEYVSLKGIMKPFNTL